MKTIKNNSLAQYQSQLLAQYGQSYARPSTQSTKANAEAKPQAPKKEESSPTEKKPIDPNDPQGLQAAKCGYAGSYLASR